MESLNMGPVFAWGINAARDQAERRFDQLRREVGATRELAELMDTAGASIIAITEPEEYRVPVQRSGKLLEFASNHRRQTAS